MTRIKKPIKLRSNPSPYSGNFGQYQWSILYVHKYSMTFHCGIPVLLCSWPHPLSPALCHTCNTGRGTSSRDRDGAASFSGGSVFSESFHGYPGDRGGDRRNSSSYHLGWVVSWSLRVGVGVAWSDHGIVWAWVWYSEWAWHCVLAEPNVGNMHVWARNLPCEDLLGCFDGIHLITYLTTHMSDNWWSN